MDFKRFFLAAILFAIVGEAVHTVGAILEMGYYTDPAFFSVWSKIMMPGAGPPPQSFYLISAGFGLIAALIYTYVYEAVKRCIPGGDYFNRGVSFGSLLFVVGALPSTFMLILLINIPFGLIAAWAVEGLLVNLVGGMLIARIMG